MYDNTARVTLQPILAPNPDLPEPPEYAAERTRVATEIRALEARVASQQPIRDVLQDARSQMGANVQAYTQIRTEMSQYEHYENPPTSVKSLVDTLKPLRPPTAPASDLAAERNAILESSAPNFLLIQVELAVLILCLLAYSFLPMTMAPGVTVLLLSVGVAVGIFLRKG
jgi:hypothetical protein